MARVEAEAEMEQGGGTSGALEFWGPEAKSLNRAPFCAKGGCAQDKCLGDML